MILNLNRLCLFCLTSAMLLLCACFPSRKLTVVSAGLLLEEVAKSSYQQTDLRTIREGMPAYLMLMDGMIEAWPGNQQLLIAAAQAYSSFASAFVEDQDKDYARLLFEKGKQYALRALALRGIEDPAGRPLDDFRETLKTLGKRDVPYVFWAAASWGSWIRLNLDSMEAVAQLPRVEWMIQRVLDLDEGFFYGSPHLFMGIWFASRPPIAGGDLKKARHHFQKALEFGQGKFLMTYVYYADYYARQTMDKDLFISSLQKAVEAPQDISREVTLLNTVAKKKARELLARTEEYFE